MSDTPKPAPFSDALAGIDISRWISDEELGRRVAEATQAERLANFGRFLESLPETYRDTSDARKTPWDSLPDLFAANAACGALRYDVNLDAFRDTLATPADRSVYLFGSTGSGKTRAALRRAGRMILAGEVDGVDFVRFGEVARDYTRKGPDAFDSVRLRHRRLLVVDDFLNGQTIAARREAFAGDWFDLIERIATRRARCVITANADPAKIADWFAGAGVDPESVVRRIGQMFTVIGF